MYRNINAMKGQTYFQQVLSTFEPSPMTRPPQPSKRKIALRRRDKVVTKMILVWMSSYAASGRRPKVEAEPIIVVI